jgi:hypothetical protein
MPSSKPNNPVLDCGAGRELITYVTDILAYTFWLSSLLGKDISSPLNTFLQ